ncbi:MAG: NAD-dependent epimerase/dehydratase family protein [Pseudobdellovibrionaceae bacterium]
MKVIVTGANGFLGAWIVKALCDQNVEVFSLVRKSSDLSMLKDIPCPFVYGDVTELESLRIAFAKTDTVFHLAGMIAYRRSDRAMMEKINVQGTQNVVQAMIECKVPKLVHASSVAAVGAGFSKQEILNEKSDFNLSKLDLGYFETKRSAEKIVLKAAHDKQLHVSILNPATIYGFGDAKKGSRKTQVKVARGEFPFYPPGGVSVVAVEDVVEGFLRAWKTAASGERFILASENLLIKDIFDIIAKKANQKPPYIGVPSWLIHPLGQAGDLLYKAGVESSFSSETAWTSTLYHWFDSSKAQKVLGIKFSPAQGAIERSVQWMIENHYA